MNQDAAKRIVDLLKTEVTRVAIAALVAEVPFFGLWFVNPIVGVLAPYIVDALYKQLAFGINWTWILVQNHAELSKAVTSREQLAKILLSGGDYTKAEKEFDDAADALIKHNLSHLPR